MDNKQKCISIIAILLALVAISQASAISQYLTNVTCVNCTLDNPTFVNFTFPSGINQSDDTKVNKSGDTMAGDLIIQNITHPDYIHLTGINGLLFTGGDSEFNINFGFNYDFLGLSKVNYVPGNVFIPEYMQFNTPIQFVNDSNYYNNNITGVYNLNMTGDINVGGNNITNCANCYFGVSRRDISTHTLTTVYQNTNSTPRFVIVTPTAVNGDINAYISTNSTPSTLVGIASPTTTTRPQLSFWVLPMEYYKVTASGSVGIYVWVEWN